MECCLAACKYVLLYCAQLMATELVDADRTALFLVDNKQEDLYAHVFSVSLGESECVERVMLESEPSSVEDYINQLDSTLREVVSYNGKLVRSNNCYTTTS